MRKIIQMLTLLGISLSFSSCVELGILGICWLKAFPYHETYWFRVDSTLVMNDTIFIEYVGRNIPHTNSSTFAFTATNDTLHGTSISKSLAGKHKDYHFFDDAICTDTIRLYRNDTLIVAWDKANINTYHNPYNHDQWMYDYQWACSQRGYNNYTFSIKPEDIEKWKNGE